MTKTDQSKAIDLGKDSKCNECHKQKCNCPERNHDGTWSPSDQMQEGVMENPELHNYPMTSEEVKSQYQMQETMEKVRAMSDDAEMGFVMLNDIPAIAQLCEQLYRDCQIMREALEGIRKCSCGMCCDVNPSREARNALFQVSSYPPTE